MLKFHNVDNFIAHIEIEYLMSRIVIYVSLFAFNQITISLHVCPSSTLQKHSDTLPKYRGKFPLCLKQYSNFTWKIISCEHLQCFLKLCFALELITFGRQILSNRNQNGFILVIDIKKHQFDP